MALSTVSTPTLIGVAIACGGNVLISLALTVQKLAHRRQAEKLQASHTPRSDSTLTPEPRDDRQEVLTAPVILRKDSLQLDSNPDQSKRPIPLSLPLVSNENDENDDDHEEGLEVEEGMYLRSRLWWVGMALISIGEGGNFLSYGFAPASVVAPLGTVALIANCIFAPLLLKEKFQPRELIGMGLAIVGAVTVVLSSNSTNPRLDPAALLIAIRQIPFLIYTLLNLLLLISLILLSRSSKFGAKFIGIDVGICALFGGYTVLSTKALSSLLSTIFLEAFEHWIAWVLVGVLVGTSVMQIKYLNKALMRYESKEVIPTQFVFFSLAAIIGSAVLYQEFRDVPFTRFINFAFGIATTFLGVYLLTSFSQSESHIDNNTNDPSPRDSPTQLPRIARLPRPNSPQRATPSSTLNLLLPHSSRGTERTPLLIPSQTLPLPRRLSKRTSTGDFTPTRGLNSQAGFLLLASTPPSGSSFNVNARGGSGSAGAAGGVKGRDRSASRGRAEEGLGESEVGS